MDLLPAQFRHQIRTTICLISVFCEQFFFRNDTSTSHSIVYLKTKIFFLIFEKGHELQMVRKYNLFATLEPPKYWRICLIKSRANRSRIMQPFLNPNLIFFSNAPQIVRKRIIKKNQNKDLENSNSNSMIDRFYLLSIFSLVLWKRITFSFSFILIEL